MQKHAKVWQPLATGIPIKLAQKSSTESDTSASWEFFGDKFLPKNGRERLVNSEMDISSSDLSHFGICCQCAAVCMTEIQPLKPQKVVLLEGVFIAHLGLR